MVCWVYFHLHMGCEVSAGVRQRSMSFSHPPFSGCVIRSPKISPRAICIQCPTIVSQLKLYSVNLPYLAASLYPFFELYLLLCPYALKNCEWDGLCFQFHGKSSWLSKNIIPIAHPSLYQPTFKFNTASGSCGLTLDSVLRSFPLAKSTRICIKANKIK